MMEPITLSRMLGAPVYDGSGALAGRVREVAMHLQAEPNLISDFIVKTRGGDRLLSARQVYGMLGTTVRANTNAADWPPLVSSEGMLLLERDLLDQQIIDVSGRKVVRVNDVNLHPERSNGTLKIKVGRGDIGLRGAGRRLLKRFAASAAGESLTSRL